MNQTNCNGVYDGVVIEFYDTLMENDMWVSQGVYRALKNFHAKNIPVVVVSTESLAVKYIITHKLHLLVKHTLTTYGDESRSALFARAVKKLGLDPEKNKILYCDRDPLNAEKIRNVYPSTHWFTPYH
jgi:hypothetical protein